MYLFLLVSVDIVKVSNNGRKIIRLLFGSQVLKHITQNEPVPQIFQLKLLIKKNEWKSIDMFLRIDSVWNGD